MNEHIAKSLKSVFLTSFDCIKSGALVYGAKECAIAGNADGAIILFAIAIIAFFTLPKRWTEPSPTETEEKR